MDKISPERRSENMRRIRSKNTSPELFVRRALHAAGFRYTLHETKLPGKPDIVLPRYRTVVLVHGCFWHGHNCDSVRIPKSNISYWAPKIQRNRDRDKAVRAALRREGWNTRTVWECSLEKQTRALVSELSRLRAAQ